METLGRVNSSELQWCRSEGMLSTHKSRHTLGMIACITERASEMYKATRSPRMNRRQRTPAWYASGETSVTCGFHRAPGKHGTRQKSRTLMFE